MRHCYVCLTLILVGILLTTVGVQAGALVEVVQRLRHVSRKRRSYKLAEPQGVLSYSYCLQ